MSDDLERTVLKVLTSVLAETEERVRAQPVLAHHGWDSLRMLGVLAQLEKKLQITIDPRGYQSARTLDDIVRVVRETVEAKGTQAPAPAGPWIV
jgi:acyl carrier protein